MLDIESLDGLIDLSTRPKRRKTVVFIVELLGVIHTVEPVYIDRILLNFQNSDACVNVKYSVE